MLFHRPARNLFCPTLVNHLRTKQNETPATARAMISDFAGASGGFNTMCEYYGVTNAVFPIGVYTLKADWYEHTHAKYNPSQWLQDCGGEHVISSIENQTYWLKLVAGCHNRRVVSYEIALGVGSTAKIGWSSDYIKPEKTEGGYMIGYDENGTGVALLDCARGGTICEGLFQPLTSEVTTLQPTKIQTVRSHDSVAWDMNGPQVAKWNPNWSDGYGGQYFGYPCVTIKGSFTVHPSSRNANFY